MSKEWHYTIRGALLLASVVVASYLSCPGCNRTLQIIDKSERDDKRHEERMAEIEKGIPGYRLEMKDLDGNGFDETYYEIVNGEDTTRAFIEINGRNLEKDLLRGR